MVICIDKYVVKINMMIRHINLKKKNYDGASNFNKASKECTQKIIIDQNKNNCMHVWAL